jgi:hypothetical protein
MQFVILTSLMHVHAISIHYESSSIFATPRALSPFAVCAHKHVQPQLILHIL